MSTPDSATTERLSHSCTHEGCGETASFGFHTRDGVVWYCFEHRQDGEAQRVSPSR